MKGYGILYGVLSFVEDIKLVRYARLPVLTVGAASPEDALLCGCRQKSVPLMQQEQEDISSFSKLKLLFRKSSTINHMNEIRTPIAESTKPWGSMSPEP